MRDSSRREFLKWTATVPAAAAISGQACLGYAKDGAATPSHMQLGLVTYNWGRQWDLPTVIRNCEDSGFRGVELRSTHKHGVEPSIDKKKRKEIAQRFADSPVKLVGLGSACEYHSPDKKVLQKNIDETKAFVTLCHDVGGKGVKVRPNGLPSGVPVEKTLEQIGRALNEVAEFAEGYGVQIRLEVHGRGTAHLPHVKTIMDAADNKNTVVCWNCNRQDLEGKGLEHNFNLVKSRIGIIHIHDLRNKNYPWKELFGLLKQAKFTGWTLVEEGRVPADIVGAMKENRKIWEKLALDQS